MGRVKVAAHIIMKDKRENAEKRKMKAKNKGDRFVNKNETKQFSETHRKRRGPGPYGVKPGMNQTEEEREGEEIKTITSVEYENLMNHKEYVLTMQQELINEEDLDELEEQETQASHETDKLDDGEYGDEKSDAHEDDMAASISSNLSKATSSSRNMRRLSTSQTGATALILEAKLQADKETKEYDSRTRERWYIISCQSGRFGKYDPNELNPGTDWLTYWNTFVMCLAIYNSFITPFQFSFEYVQLLLTT